MSLATGFGGDDGENKWEAVPLEELPLSVRTYNILRRRGGIETIGQLMRLTIDDFCAMRHWGRVCHDELRQALIDHGIPPPPALWEPLVSP